MDDAALEKLDELEAHPDFYFRKLIEVDVVRNPPLLLAKPTPTNASASCLHPPAPTAYCIQVIVFLLTVHNGTCEFV